MVILSIKVTFILSQGKIINLKKNFFHCSLQIAYLSCKSIGWFFKNRSLYRDSRCIETRYIERPLHGKRWGKNRDRTFLLVIEKTRYIETRYRERRLQLECESNVQIHITPFLFITTYYYYRKSLNPSAALQASFKLKCMHLTPYFSSKLL